MSVFLALGFRPFFLLAGFLAVILIASGSGSGGRHHGQQQRRPEWLAQPCKIFGYAVAVIAGL